MNIRTANFEKPLAVLLLALMTLTAGRGLLRITPLAGHDAAAHPVNQAQFLENLRDGVLFPRWSADTRFGYGQPQLQFRPPLLHYLASPIHAVTGNPFLALHLALFGSLFMAAWGAYSLARLRVGEGAALAAAAGFVCANYMLANLYLRGAYYEVMASAAMPWILWAQSRENVTRRSGCLIGPVAWAALFMGHPAVSFFFFPLAIAHVLSEAFYARRGSILSLSFSFLIIGVLLSAPYTWVMLAERQWVRMEIFLSDLNSWRRHFLSLRELFTESWPRAAHGWPATYMEFSGVDHLGRALHPEMRGLNFWAMTILFFAPLVWGLMLWKWHRSKTIISTPAFGHPSNGGEQILIPSREGQGWVGQNDILPTEKLFYAVFFYTAAWLSVMLSLKMSLPVWNHIPVMDTFNYPWRVLNVTSLCVALTTAYTLALLSEIMKRRRYHLVSAVIIALFILGPLAEAVPHTGGWSGPDWLTREALTPTAIRRHAGVPQQFYTPVWVRRYAAGPAPSDAQVVEGQATVTVVERHPTRWYLHVEAATPARIALSHYYYPGWCIYGPDGVIIRTEPWGERALISFVVPAGTHEIELYFGNTTARGLANFAFIAGLALMLFGVLWPRRKLSSESTEPSRRSATATLLSSDIKSEVARPLRGRASLRVFAFSMGSVILFVIAILLAEHLVNSRDDEARTVQAGQQLAQGNNLAAIHSFARLLRERETDIAARYNLGAAYHNYGWHDEALADYNDVLELANEYAAKAAHSAARIWLMRKDFESARRYYEEALQHRPDAQDIRAEYEELMLRIRARKSRKNASFP